MQVNSQIPVIVKDWATYMGNSEDSIFKTPLVTDSGNTYVASFTINTNSGADILIAKYNDEGQPLWTQTWTGPGNGRDQASAIFVDDESVYVTGITFTSVANNFDYVTLRLSKTTGAIDWVKTFNGTASIYDVATAITAIGKYVYVTGLANNLNTSIDYTTIKYAKTAGTELWIRNFDRYSLMDIPFGISIVGNDTNISITGASQHTLTDWDYATIFYKNNGDEKDTNIVSGTASGFDRAQAVKSDALGNIYITGTISQSITGYDIKTVKIDPNGNVNWQVTYDNDSSVDEGIDLIIDGNQNVYVCGKSQDTISYFDYVIRKYNSSGVVKWTKRVDLSGDIDEPRKMCFDSFGNIIVTGKGINQQSESYDFFTVALDTGGIEIWRQTYGLVFKEDDQAQDLAADENGNIYVTGEVILEENGSPQTVAIKYRSDYFTDPQQIDTPAVANYYYTNYGQIADENGNATDPEKLQYYTIHHSPQLYFQQGKMSMVFSHIDADTSTEDTLQRVDVTFLNSGNPTIAYPVNEMREAGYYNYFLAHCPEGITDVLGNEKLLFEDVYEGIDALYSSNNAGLKLYFICDGNSNPSQIGLFFEGQDNLQIVNNWGLQVETAVGYYEFEKPRVYRIQSNGTVRNTGWQLNWNIPNPGEAKMIGWGEWGPNETLVIEISKTILQNFSCTENLCWSTHYGGNGAEDAGQITRDNNNFIYTVGNTNSSIFPIDPGVFRFQPNFGGFTDAFVSKFSASSGSPDNLKWITYYGGLGLEEGRSIAINYSTNEIYFTGVTLSTDNSLPTQNDNNSPFFNDVHNGGVLDAYLAKLNDNGNDLLYGTYIGGGDQDGGFTVTINQNDGSLYLGGHTTSDGTNLSAFFCTPSSSSNSYNQNVFGGNLIGGLGDGFIMKFDPSDNLLWSTFYGGSGEESVAGIIVTDNDDIIVVGNTNSENSQSGTASPYCLANNNQFFQLCDQGGSSYFDNDLNSSETLSVHDLFIAAFNISDQLIWSTYFGGDNIDHSFESNPISTTYTPSDKYAITGFTNSSTSSFPVLYPVGSYEQGYSGGLDDPFDAFIAVFTNEFDLTWCSYYGGDNNEFGRSTTFDSGGNLYITGNTNSLTPSTPCTSPISGNFPVCDANSFFYNNPIINLGFPTGSSDAYLAQFDQFYAMQLSTYIGGSRTETGNSIIVNDFSIENHLFFYGTTQSPKDEGGSLSLFPPALSSGYWDQGYDLRGSSDNQICMFDLGQFVSIEEINLKVKNLQIYPNPTSDYLNVQLNLNINNNKNNLLLEVYDLNGRCLIKNNLHRINSKEFIGKIKTENISQGLYFIRVYSDKEIITSKFIKQ